MINLNKYKNSIVVAALASTFLINAGSLPSSSSSSGNSTSVSSKSGGNSMTSNAALDKMQLENGLRLVEGLVYTRKFKKALNKLRVLEDKYADNADVHNYLGFVYRKMNELGKSGDHYNRALRINPRHIGALEYQGELFVMTGQIQKAKKNLNSLELICGTKCKEYSKLKKVIDKNN